MASKRIKGKEMRGSLVLFGKKGPFKPYYRAAKWHPKPRRKLKIHQESMRKRNAGPSKISLPGKKASNQMLDRGQSAVEEIRNPKRAKYPNKTWKIVRGDYVSLQVSSPTFLLV